MNAWIFFSITTFIVILGIGITFLIIWLTKSSGKANAKKELAINGLKISLANPTTVTSTWDSVGNSGDEVTMYADTKNIDLDADGKPEATKNPNVLTAGPVAGSVKTLSISTLKVNQKYYVQVVVTNPKISGFNSEMKEVYTGIPIPPGDFSIHEFDSQGSISLASDNMTVTYEKNEKSGSDIWTYNSNNFTISGAELGGNTAPVLYNNNGILAATDPDDVTVAQSIQWTYTDDNRWCLKNSPEVCMHLGTPNVKSSPIQVTSGSKSQWQNISTLLSTDSPFSM